MKRVIKFRGKTLEGDFVYEPNKWVEGDLLHSVMGKDGLIYETSIKSAILYHVDPKTICQYTGFEAERCKKNLTKEIYEGDIFRQEDTDDRITYLVVMWIWQLGAFYLIPIEHYYTILDNDVSKEKEFGWLFEQAMLNDFSIDIGLTKVGNVVDNPGLLE